MASDVMGGVTIAWDHNRGCPGRPVGSRDDAPPRL